MMLDLSYWMPTKIFYGKGCVRENNGYFSSLGKKCLIVTGKSSAKRSGALDDVRCALETNHISYEVFDEVEQNPLLSTCARAGKRAREMGADFLIGIGGGSPLDAVKSAAVFAANDFSDQMEIYRQPYPRKPLPFVLVGTTAGTGSEVTQYSVLTVDGTDGKPGRKKTVKPLFADACFGDYSYTQSLSEQFTIATALDAFCHCIESYFSTKADTLSELYAREGAKLLLDVFLDLPKDGAFTPKQREKLYAASIYGGLAIAKTGTCYCHAMGYFLSEEYGIPHGTACAVFLPSFLKLGCETEGKKADQLLFELDIRLSELCDVVESLTDFTPFPLREEQREELYRLWSSADKFSTSPGEFTIEDAKSLLEEIFPLA